VKWRINKKWLLGLAGLLAVCAANHIEYAWRSRAAAARGAPKLSVIVKQEEGAVGHRTIGVAEASLPDQAGTQVLRFGTLAAWNYEREKSPPCPQAIAALSGNTVMVVGFMYPLETGSQVKTFCLLRSTQTCCYGPRPQYNQYLLVEMRGAPVKFERLAPVMVEGRFLAEAHPEDGYIYKLEGTSACAADGEQTEIDAAAAAKAAGLMLFDFAWLEAMRPSTNGAHIPVSSELAALDGRRVVVEGFCVGQTKGAAPGIILGRNWWDGVAQGTPSDLYNAVKVFLAGESEFPSRWQDRAVFTGTLHVAADPKDWPAQGVVSLRDAVKGVPGHGPNATTSHQAGPYLPLPIETVLLGSYVAAAFIQALRRSARNASSAARKKGRTDA